MDMIERVVEAIEAVPVMARTYRMSGDDAVALARAAINAIEQAGFVIVPREPTAEMIRHGMFPITSATGDEEGGFQAAPEAWRAMIDAALADPPLTHPVDDGGG